MSKILIIEDEEAIADLEKDYLELSGFEVEIANRGDTGLEKGYEGRIRSDHSGSDASGSGRIRYLQAGSSGKKYTNHHGFSQKR